MSDPLPDPWGTDSSDSVEHDLEQCGDNASMCFEDSFVGSQSFSPKDHNNERLPDSAQYLASLGIPIILAVCYVFCSCTSKEASVLSLLMIKYSPAN